MDKKHIIKCGLMNAVGVFIYTSCVVFVMTNIEKVISGTPGVLGAVMMLLLFVLSATVVGALVLGKPILLYFENKKQEALSLFLATTGWLFIIILVVFVILLATHS